MPCPEPPAAVESRIPLPELIAGLSRPEAFGVEGEVQVIQTHISVVFLAGDRAWKVKKPLRLWGFLDYGTVAARKACCEAEVTLNRRLAPDVYRGVVPIVRLEDGRLAVDRPGEVIDHAVEMVRLPEGVTFLERLEEGTLEAEDLREAARLLADFHRRNRLAPSAAAHTGPAVFAEVVRQNFLATHAGVPDVFPAAAHEGLRHRVAERIRACRHLMRARVDAGRLVDGHGDVRLEHVVRRGRHVEVVDCVEFSEKVRHVDPLSDAAFLSMDLAVRGRWDLAHVFESTYVEASAEDPDVAATLLPVYLAYRSHVRAKVGYQTSLEAEIPEATRREKARAARRHLALAWTHARAGETPPIVVLRGPSGVGKSRFASAIAPWLGAEVLRSDVIRKELAGLAPTDRLDEAGNARLYGKTMSVRTYEELLARAEAALGRDRAVLLDATYLHRASRDEARTLARRLGAPFAIADVTCDDAEIRRRLAARQAEGKDASDADVRIYEEQVRTEEPCGADEMPYVARVPSDDPPEVGAMAILDRLEASISAGAAN